MEPCNFDLICPNCGKNFKYKENGEINKNQKSSLNKHLIYCDKKYEFLNKHSFDKDSLESELRQLGSVQEFMLKYNECNLNFYKLFKDFQISTSIKLAVNSKSFRDKVKNTNMSRYGTPHNFCKDNPSRIKWEKRLFDDEGIVNVFQRESVKEKLVNTLVKRYGVTSAAKSDLFKVNLAYCENKFGVEQGKIEYDRICYDRGNSNRLDFILNKYGNAGYDIYKNCINRFVRSGLTAGKYTKLNKKFEEILKENLIEYELEYKISFKDRRFYYDFKINNNLIEINGDFWHANPNKYKADDILNFPGTKCKAKDVWLKDEIKKNAAIENNFNIIYFWECDINDPNKINDIVTIIKNL